MVEGPSDLIYLQVLGEAVLAKGGEALDPRWVVVPVGGADKLSTFVSLIGANQLNLAVLMDVSQRNQQRFRELQKNGHLPKNALIEVGQFVGRGDADIEDLFADSFYLKLVNGAYSKELSPKLTLKALADRNPRIVRRIDSYFKDNQVGTGRFSHYRPAAYLQREQATLLDQVMMRPSSEPRPCSRSSTVCCHRRQTEPDGMATCDSADTGAKPCALTGSSHE